MVGSDITQSQIAGLSPHHQHPTKLQSNFGNISKIVCSVPGVEVITFLTQSVSHLNRMEDLLARLETEA